MTPKGACCRWNDLPQLFAQQARAAYRLGVKARVLVGSEVALREAVKRDPSEGRFGSRDRMSGRAHLTDKYRNRGGNPARRP